MYLTAPILRCAFKPSVNVSGALPSSFSRASVASSFLRSDLVPISISGVAGQWYWSSGYHCVQEEERGREEEEEEGGNERYRGGGECQYKGVSHNSGIVLTNLIRYILIWGRAVQGKAN